MTIKRCSSCGKPFSNKKSRYSNFCSEQCKNKYYDLLNDMSYSDSLIESDLKAKKEDQARDQRLIRK